MKTKTSTRTNLRPGPIYLDFQLGQPGLNFFLGRPSRPLPHASLSQHSTWNNLSQSFVWPNPLRPLVQDGGLLLKKTYLKFRPETTCLNLQPKMTRINLRPDITRLDLRLGPACNIPGAPRPEHVRLLQPDAPQPLTLLRPFILGGLLPVGIEPLT